MTSFHIAIIGAGPSGLAAAEELSGTTLAGAQLQIDLYDRMPSPARKFLMAGRGGLNLTHSEPFERLLARYGDAGPWLEDALRAFPPDAVRQWARELGEETFVGTSGHVFPKSFKASPLLRAWLKRLGRQGVTLHPRHDWRGWTKNGRLAFSTPDGPREIEADAVLLALGGASWPRLGSDGGWVELLQERGVAVNDLVPSNMGVQIRWSDVFRDRFAGTPLKRIALSCGGMRARGEAMITAQGLEGGVVYALSRRLRQALASRESATDSATLLADLRPDVDVTALAMRLAAAPSSLSFSNLMRRAAGLSPAATGVLREAMGPRRPQDPSALAQLIKAVPLAVTGTAGISRAISSAGGIARDEIGTDFALKRLPGTFASGEMLDWDAPTGGYLLQACFSTGRAAARGILAHLAALQAEKPPASR